MEENPYVSPTTTEAKPETPQIIQGGDLGAVARGLRYLGFGAAIGTVGTLVAVLLEQMTPDSAGDYVWLLMGSQLLSAVIAALGLIMCLDVPAAARSKGLVVVALAVNVAACFACGAVLGGIVTSPMMTMLIAIGSAVSAGCILIFLHRLATALDSYERTRQIVVLLVCLLVWIATAGLLQVAPYVGGVVFVAVGLGIAWNYVRLVLEMATLANRVEQLRQADKWRASSGKVERLLNAPMSVHLTPEPQQVLPVEGPMPIVARGIRCVFWSTMVNMIGTAGVAYFALSGDDEVVRSVLPFALGAQAIAAFALFAGFVMCLVGAPAKLRYQLLMVGAIVFDALSILLGLIVVAGVIPHPAILFLGAIFGLMGWGCFITFLHGLALSLGSRETANDCVGLVILVVVWVALTFVYLFSALLAFFLLVVVGLYVIWSYLMLLLEVGYLAKEGGVASPIVR